MRHLVFILVALLILQTVCVCRDLDQCVVDRITEGFVETYVRPHSDPVATLVENGKELPPPLLASNRVLRVEFQRRKEKRRTLFESGDQRPPSSGMITGIEQVRNIGLYLPVSSWQPEIEVRMNYFCANGDFVAVHVAVPNPLIVAKDKNQGFSANMPGQKPTPENPKADMVVVKTLDAPLPREAEMRAAFLWDRFANKPEEEKFSCYSVKNWEDNFTAFRDALVRKAGQRKLDSDSLRRALDLILKDSKGKTACLPVGAYQTTLNGTPIWIITAKWENISAGNGAELGHIRMFAFDQKSLVLVGFDTCM